MPLQQARRECFEKAWRETWVAGQRVNILKPGCGVGGHCIAVDPYFIVSDYPMESKIIGTAREVNNYKSFWCAEKVQNEKSEFNPLFIAVIAIIILAVALS